MIGMLYKIFQIILGCLLIFNNFPLYALAENEDDFTIEEVYPGENEEEDNAEIKTETSSVKEKEVLKGYVSKVPSGTKIKVIVETPINEETVNEDDEFTAKTSEDILVDEETIVPAGSTVKGVISDINHAKRLHRSGSVRIEFKSILKPDGVEVPIVASVLTHSGLLKGKLTPKNALISTATVATPALAGAGAGIAAEGSGLGLVVGAALGLLGGIALYFYQRGNMVDIKAGDELKIELTEEALVPVASNPNDQTNEASVGLID